jgi:hypothetical protein
MTVTFSDEEVATIRRWHYSMRWYAQGYGAAPSINVPLLFGFVNKYCPDQATIEGVDIPTLLPLALSAFDNEIRKNRRAEYEAKKKVRAEAARKRQRRQEEYRRAHPPINYAARASEIWNCRNIGESWRSIAGRVGLSTERTRQIFLKTERTLQKALKQEPPLKVTNDLAYDKWFHFGPGEERLSA